MRNKILLFFAITISMYSSAQVGIGTSNPDASAALEIQSTSRGLLIPKLSKIQRDAINSPAVGLLLYQTDNNPGFYYYNASNTWIRIGSNNTSNIAANTASITANINDIALKAPLASPTFTGTPSLPTGTTGITQSPANNSTAIATTAYVDNAASTASRPLTDGNIFLGNSSNVATGVAISGDVTMDNTGVTTIGASKVVNAMINNDAVTTAKIADGSITDAKIASAINATKLADGSVTNTELQYIGTLTSNAQTQIDAVNTTGSNNTSNIAANTASITANINDIALKAPLASPTFTGTPSLPTGTTGITQSPANNSTAIATTAYVDNAASTASRPLTDGNIFLGNSSNVATGVAISGDVTMDNTGVTTIGASKVVNAMINNDAVTTAKIADGSITDAKIASAINATKLADGSVTNTELQYIGTLTSNAQTQIDAVNTTGSNNTSNIAANTASITANINDIALKAPLASPTFTGTTTLGTTVLHSAQINTTLSVGGTTALASTLNVAGTTALGSTLDVAGVATFNGNVIGITKAKVGLDNVDNTSDANKPISTAGQTALNLKAPLASPTFTGTPSLPTGTTGITQSPANNSTAIATTAYVDNAASTASRPLTDGNIFLGNSSNVATGVAISGDVTMDNTGVTTIGASKVVNAMINNDAVTTAKIADGSITDAKIASAINATKLADGSVTNTELQYIGTLTSNAQTQIDAVNTTGSNNTSNIAANTASITANINDIALKAPLASPTFTGTTTLGTTVLHSAQINTTLSVGGTTALASTLNVAGTTALGSTLDVAGVATFNGNVIGITKAKVGLDNVDNTSDANKPISTAGQTALNLKAPLASPTFTGTPSLPTGTTGITQSPANNSTAIATTAYVDNAASTASRPLTDGNIFLGNSSNVATGVAISGDVTMDNTGVTTIGASKVVNAMINNDAVTTAKIADGSITDAKIASAINATKLADGSVTNTELQYIGTLTSNAQTQIDAVNTTGSNNTSNIAANTASITANINDIALKAPLASPTFTGTVTVPTLVAGTNTFPTVTGSANQVLTTNGSGTLAWTTIASGATNLNGLSDAVVSNQETIIIGSTPNVGTTARYSTGVGKRVLESITEGDENVAMGHQALGSTTTGSFNTAMGSHVNFRNTTGNYNSSFGVRVLENTTTGSSNTGIGSSAGDTNTTGSNNTFIGRGSDANANNLTNATAIGYNASVNASNKIRLGDSNITNVETSGTVTIGAITIPNTDGTANQILETDGSGTLSWATPSAGISGSGTVNMIPKFSGSTTALGNSSIYDDGTNIGIGTTSPAGLLHLKAASGDAKAIISAPAEDDEAHLMLKTGGFDKTAVVATGIDNWGLSDLRFILNSSTNQNSYGLSDTKMIIKNDGKVGIGKEAPSEKLDVAGAIRFSGALKPNNSSGTSGQVLTSAGSGGTPTWTTIASGATNISDLSDVITSGQGSILIGGGSSSANYNTALGYNSLNSTSAEKNSAFGYNALNSSTTGASNSAFGQDAAKNITSGQKNTAIGQKAGIGNITGSENTLIGFDADVSSNNLTNATAIGANATVNASNKIRLGDSNVINVETSGTITAGAITIPNTDGTANQVLKTNGSGSLSWTTIASGATNLNGLSDAVVSNQETIIIGSTPNVGTTARYSTGVGKRVLESITEGDENVAMGHQALGSTTTGSFNTAMGSHVNFRNTTGNYNSSFGVRVLENTTTGSSNTGIGSSAGDTNTTGSNNTFIGRGSDANANNLTNATAIGYNASVNASNKIRLGDSNITNVETSGTVTIGAITIPNTDGTANQILETDGSGTLSWATPSAGISGSGTVNMIPKFSGSTTALGNSSIYDDGTNIGIGTTSPAGLLHLKAASGDAKAIISAPAEDDEAHLMLKTGGFDKTAVVATGIDNWGLSDLRFILNSSTNQNSYGLSDTKMIIKNDGKVGIGKEAPSEKLDVAGAIRFSGALKPNNSSGTSGQVLTSAGSGGTPTWTTIASGATNISDLSDVITSGQGSILIGGGSSSANYNTALGYNSLNSTSAEKNSAFGYNALNSSTTGASNSAFGQDAAKNITSGQKNTAIGQKAGIGNITGSENTLIGFDADVSSNNLTNATAIGANATVNASNKIRLGDSNVINVETSGTITAGAITIPNTDGSANQVLKTDGSGTLSWATPSAGISGSGTVNMIPKFSGSTTALGNSSIYDDGTNIGIGTTSPAGLLHLKAASGDAKAIISAPAEDDEAHLMLKTGGFDKTAVVATGIDNWGLSDLRFILNSSTNQNSYGLSDTKMIIKNDGKVGIGKEAPSEKLDVAGAIRFSGALKPNNSSGTSGQVLTSAGSGGTPTWTTIASGATNLNGLSDAVVSNQETIIIGSTPNVGTTARYSTGVGKRVLESITEGDENVAMGHQALGSTTTGSFNTAMGSHVNFRNTTGNYNSSFGVRVLENTTTGSSNTGIGSSAGDTNTTGSNNTFIGRGSDANANNLTNATAIGYNASVNASNKIRLGDSNVINVETSGTITAGAITIPNTDGSANQVLKTDGSGTLSWAAVIIDVTDEFTASASQTSFTLTQTPTSNSKVKMFVNGVRISNTAYSWSGTTLTLYTCKQWIVCIII